VIQQWDEILRMIATIKLKEVTASDLFAGSILTRNSTPSIGR
jgi:hypothetical protein